MGEELKKYKYEIVAAVKNGHCFIASLRYCLERDHGIKFTEGDIKKLITYEVFQNNNYYQNFYNGSVLSMLRSLDRYIIKGIYTHQVVDIAILAAANILRVNLCIYKNVNDHAILYAQPTDPPSPRDVYLKYDNEHYDLICAMNCSDTCSPTFNLTQSDIDAFALIGASFHVTNPMNVVNGGKLYFVPPKNFSSYENDFDFGYNTENTDGTTEIEEPTENVQKSSTDNTGYDGSQFVPNSDMLENGVRNFNSDTQMIETDLCEEEDELKNSYREYRVGEDDDEDDEVYEMFAGLDLSEKVPEEFQFEEDNSGNEDAVLDNSECELENVTPLKPQRKKKITSLNMGKMPKVRKQLDPNSESTHKHMYIDLTVSKEKSPSSSQNEVCFDLTPPTNSEKQKTTEVLIDLTNSSSSNADNNATHNSEVVNSNSSSFMSDSSSSTSRQKPRKYKKVIIDERRMSRAPVKYVEEIPWDINGDRVYKVKCTEENWIDTYEDGHWFFLRNSTRNGLKGYRRTGKCLGSFICKEGDCPKLTAEDVVNTVDFRRVSKNVYACACCGHTAERIYCGAIKAVEFDKVTQMLKYEHQGDHICAIKPNVKEHRKALDNLPIPITGYTKPTKYMKDCMYHYIDREDYDAEFDVSEAVSLDDVIAKVKKLRRHPNQCLHEKDEVYAFKNVSRIQQSLLKSDKDWYVVYKWECKLLGRKASYVFKTSAISLKIAAMMAGALKVGGQDSSLMKEPAFFDGMHSRVKFFVSLTLWAFHPAMRMMMLLAVMDTPRRTFG